MVCSATVTARSTPWRRAQQSTNSFAPSHDRQQIRVGQAASALAGNRASHRRPVGQSFHGDGLGKKCSQHEIRKP
jgi:hypothetical protein